MRRSHSRQAFTLIELSIVLVIIGLLVGGVLVGQDLIKSAEARAQVTQIEKYNTAVNTFRAKFNALPGDMDPVTAAQFSFAPRGQYAGEGDGNGLLQGVSQDAPNFNAGYLQGAGETVMFWKDLTQVNLTEGAYTLASATTLPSAYVPATGLNQYFPSAKVGAGAIVYVQGGSVYTPVSTNYFGIMSPYGIDVTYGGYLSRQGMSLTVRQAYSIDTKIDDGLPSTGNVLAQDIAGWTGAFPGAAASPSSTTCYDNGGNASVPFAYSVATNGGNGKNCDLSFKFQ